MANGPESKPLKIGQAARKLNIAVETIRMYERAGLLISQKTATGQRAFEETDLHWIGCIRRMIKEKGLNLEGIRRLLALMPCWELKPCTSADKNTCPAFTGVAQPCWTLKPDIPEICRQANCRECKVYKSASNCSNLESLLYELKHRESPAFADTCQR